MFLHGKLDENNYMDQSKDFVVYRKEHLICKLKKSFYGLKQLPTFVCFYILMVHWLLLETNQK